MGRRPRCLPAVRRIRNTGHEWRFRPDDHEIDGLSRGEIHHGRGIRWIERNLAGQGCRARVARPDEQHVEIGATGNRRRQGMFTAAPRREEEPSYRHWLTEAALTSIPLLW